MPFVDLCKLVTCPSFTCPSPLRTLLQLWELHINHNDNFVLVICTLYIPCNLYYLGSITVIVYSNTNRSALPSYYGAYPSYKFRGIFFFKKISRNFPRYPMAHMMLISKVLSVIGPIVHALHLMYLARGYILCIVLFVLC
jgi:hypothetical protein